MNAELWLDAAEFLAILTVGSAVWIAFLFGLVWIITQIEKRL